MSKLLVLLIRVYQLTLKQLILAVFGPVCRFQPSCSRYAIECITIHGALYGSLLSARRLCRCHPFHPGGFDPPPPPRVRGTAPKTSNGPDGDATPISPPTAPDTRVDRRPALTGETG